MKATGIVRRIDDLGRVVIPKEIRRTLRVREGDPLELFMDGKNLILQKYEPLPQFNEDIDNMTNDIYDLYGYNYKDKYAKIKKLFSDIKVILKEIESEENGVFSNEEKTELF